MATEQGARVSGSSVAEAASAPPDAGRENSSGSGGGRSEQLLRQRIRDHELQLEAALVALSAEFMARARLLQAECAKQVAKEIVEFQQRPAVGVEATAAGDASTESPEMERLRSDSADGAAAGGPSPSPVGRGAGNTRDAFPPATRAAAGVPVLIVPGSAGVSVTAAAAGSSRTPTAPYSASGAADDAGDSAAHSRARGRSSAQRRVRSPARSESGSGDEDSTLIPTSSLTSRASSVAHQGAEVPHRGRQPVRRASAQAAARNPFYPDAPSPPRSPLGRDFGALDDDDDDDDGDDPEPQMRPGSGPEAGDLWTDDGDGDRSVPGSRGRPLKLQDLGSDPGTDGRDVRTGQSTNAPVAAVGDGGPQGRQRNGHSSGGGASSDSDADARSRELLGRARDHQRQRWGEEERGAGGLRPRGNPARQESRSPPPARPPPRARYFQLAERSAAGQHALAAGRHDGSAVAGKRAALMADAPPPAASHVRQFNVSPRFLAHILSVSRRTSSRE